MSADVSRPAHDSMHVKLALVCYLLIVVIGAVEGRFDTADQLPAAPEDLEYVFIIFRHGLRSPVNNIYGSEDQFLKRWPDGPGGLTEEGKRLMVNVGRSLRTRYKKLVPDYDKDLVEFTSTQSPRATMSAYAVATGMFPPKEVLFQDIPAWQPIPVWHTAGYDKAAIFDETKDKTQCPRYIKIRDSVIEKESYKLSRNQKNVLRKINKKLFSLKSSPKTEIKNLDDFFNVWDVYFMEQLNGKKSERWSRDLMPDMTQLAKFRLWSRMHGKTDGQNSILQYYTGPLLYQILINEMIGKSSECLRNTLANSVPYKMGLPKCRPRLHVHGSHDLTVGALVWALVDNQEQFMAYPGDALILEGYRHQGFKMFLYSPLAPAKKFQPLSMKGICNVEYCRFHEVISSLRKRGLVFPEKEWQQKCGDLKAAEKAKWRKIP